MRRRGIVLVLAAVVMLPGCSGRLGPAPAISSPAVATIAASDVSGVSIEIHQARSDWALRVVQLRVFNNSPTAWAVGTVALTTPLVAGTARAAPPGPPVIEVGGDHDVSVALGAPRCPDVDQTPAQVVVTLIDSTGRHAELSVLPTDPQGHLARIHREDCARQAVEAGARLTLGGELAVEERAGRLVGTLSLTMHRVAGGPAVVLTGVDGTVLLSPLTPWVFALKPAPGADETGVQLDFTAARCDPHAVAEDKRGTFFGIHADVDGVPAAVFYLAVSSHVRGQIHDYIGRACGW